MKQQTLAVAGDQNAQYEPYRRPTKCDAFRRTMEQILPWSGTVQRDRSARPEGWKRPPVGGPGADAAHVLRSETGLAHSAVVTAANAHDKHPLPDLLHGQEDRVYGDCAYASQLESIRAEAPNALDLTNMVVRKGSPTEALERTVGGFFSVALTEKVCLRLRLARFAPFEQLNHLAHQHNLSH